MGEEIELAAKTSAEVLTALTEASGALGPPQEFWGAITNGIHYRFYPRVVKQAMAAAEKIERSGLPRRAYSEIPDRLLKAILEGGSLEDDERMQDRWANLLANAMAESSAKVRAAFPRMLSDLEPYDATTLDRVAEIATTESERTLALKDGVDLPVVENLARLELVRYNDADVRVKASLEAMLPEPPVQVSPVPSVEIAPTGLGQAFVQACQAPQPPSSDTAET
jgi:hypothetical protein